MNVTQFRVPWLPRRGSEAPGACQCFGGRTLFHLPGGAEEIHRGVGAPEDSFPSGPPQWVGTWTYLSGEAVTLPLPEAQG